jgi:hypothetical protein
VRVLLISPDTFGYYLSIQKAFIKQGFEVDWINHHYFNSVLSKIFARLFPKSYSYFVKRLFKKKILQCKTYNFIIVIKGEGISKQLVLDLKANCPMTKFIYYTWDSISNLNGVESTFDAFDVLKTFDSNDANEIEGFSLLPLFYTDDYRHCVDGEHRKYSLSFVGTIHSDRYRFAYNVKSLLGDVDNVRVFFFFYYPNKLIFSVLQTLFRRFRFLSKNEVSFSKLSSVAVSKIMNQSEAVLDYNHPGQSGLTMRTFECLGLQKKIITTNKNIRDYDFYRDNNVYVFGEGRDLADFLAGSYEEIPLDIYEKYNVNSWVKELVKI